ncbi:MAG: hypothetical protein ACFE0R_10030 [Salinarimonas sp.]
MPQRPASARPRPAPLGPATTPAQRRGGSNGGAPLGGEPPLDPAGDDAPIARRAVSWRWLAGGVLTGATGALLIGAAIVVAI